VPRTKVVFYREAEDTVPLLEWFEKIPARAKAKCRLRLDRLGERGHELRRPEADYLRDGIYELRVAMGSVNYRMLYFFCGTTAAVVSHGLAKEQAVPAREIELARRRKDAFTRDPAAHTCEEQP
jgi:phage-related protein